MPQLRVLVVGASIAGPMAAYWLAKAGAEVTCIERFPSLRKGGQVVDIRHSAVTIVRKVPKLEEALVASGAPLQGLQMVGKANKPLVAIQPTGIPEEQFLISDFEIFRDDLATVLYDLTKDNPSVRYVFGETVSAMRQEKEKVIVDFANGLLPQSRYDLVVAADGATSRTRALGFNCNVRDGIDPYNAWAAYCTIDKDLLNGSNMGEFSVSTPGRGIMLGPDHVKGANRVILMGNNPRDMPERLLPYQEAAKKGDNAMKTYLVDFFKGHGRDEILAAVAESDSLYATECVQVKFPRLFNGNFVLVGDAGYSPGPIGTGTTLAITGAYVLAGEINNHPGDMAAALQAYSDRMQPIIKDMQKIPAGFPSVMTPETDWGLWLRDTLLYVISYVMVDYQLKPVAQFFRWIAGLYCIAWARDSYGIPDYEWKA
ncbi:hypothetical protein LTR17_010420 [Elasticomyces elasticus]|nr:hypothetical protein LTR17_010420 [Elasticomyces elasticus]